jgi:membrane-bound inhibitor of C-type lysozyme
MPGGDEGRGEDDVAARPGMRAMHLAGGIAILALLAACGSPSGMSGPPGAGRPLPGLLPGEERVGFRCANGTEVTMRFFPEFDRANLWQDGVQTEMTGENVAGGRLYSSGTTRAMVSPDRSNMTLRVGMAAETQCRAVGTPPRPPAPPPPPPGQPMPPPAESRATYRCDDGQQVNVRFFPQQGVAVLERGGQSMELPQQPAPPPAWKFGTAQNQIEGRGSTMTITVGRMVPINCTATGAPPNVAPMPPQGPTRPPAPSPPPPPPTENRGTFRCDNGETVVLRSFPGQGVAVLERGGQSVELQEQRVASGFAYSNGQTTVRGKGMTEFTLTVGNMAPTQCRIL